MDSVFDRDLTRNEEFASFLDQPLTTADQALVEKAGADKKAKADPLENAKADALRNPCPDYYNRVNVCRLRYDSAYPAAACVTQYNSPFLSSTRCHLIRK